MVNGEVEDKYRIDHAPHFFNNQQSTIITRQSSISLSRCRAVCLRMVNGTNARGIGFQPVRLEQQKDGNHEHLRTNVMKTVTGWKPIPREQTACSTRGWVSVQSRACLSNHMSDLTKALWLISEESSPGDLSIMSAVNLPLPLRRSIWFGLEHRKPMLNRIESIIDLQRTC